MKLVFSEDSHFFFKKKREKFASLALTPKLKKCNFCQHKYKVLVSSYLQAADSKKL